MPDKALKDRHVLVAEDEFLVAEELSMDLVDAGAVVVGPAARAADALDLIVREAKIDGAILDVNLGGEMVFAVADLLTERGVPFIFTTGYDLSVIPKRFGSVRRYGKPIDMAVVVRALRDLMRA